jgi:hypothetical protein
MKIIQHFTFLIELLSNYYTSITEYGITWHHVKIAYHLYKNITFAVQKSAYVLWKVKV